PRAGRGINAGGVLRHPGEEAGRMVRLRLILLLFIPVSLLVAGTGAFVRGPQKAEADFPASELSTNLLFECLPDSTVRVLLNWTTFGQGLQWLDLSLFDNDFAPGTFLSAGPLPQSQSGLVWDGLLPATLNFARVNTLT